ncbi:MAG TPA: lysophospholipid acyltransferase family protein [Chthoniobacteraceae bacterium]|nr:lysophospholipid acyltransferase family protein [Chthoniobacteraceae bacterium]
MIASCITAAAKILTGARAHWLGCGPEEKLRVYFANHTSNLDFVVLWASLPRHLRAVTRPVAAHDYWTASPMRLALAERVFKAVLIERKKVTRANNPMEPMLAALRAGHSLIIFPEGGRMDGDGIGEFRGGLYHLAQAGVPLEFVPAYIENLNRVMPKGEVLPIPILCSVTFGAPLVPDPAEGKVAFLARARQALLELSKR